MSQPTAMEGKLEDSVRVSVLQFVTARDKDLLHVVDWVQAHRDDPVISQTLDWLKSPQESSLKTALVPEADTLEGKAFIS